MKGKQYTIRAVPTQIDLELRNRAEAEQKSLNTVILETLQNAFDLHNGGHVHADLDFLIGSWEEDPAFDSVIADFKQVDEEMWQ